MSLLEACLHHEVAAATSQGPGGGGWMGYVANLILRADGTA